jgi:hypothetical protein
LFIVAGKTLIPGIFCLFKRLGKTEMPEMQKFAFPAFIKGYMPVSRPGKAIYRKKTIWPPRHIVFKYFYMRTTRLISINPDAWRAFFAGRTLIICPRSPPDRLDFFSRPEGISFCQEREVKKGSASRFFQFR